MAQIRKIIVGVDFGTTQSGLAWADTRRKRPDTIKDWPRGNGDEAKVPTTLQYEGSTISGRHTWGFEVNRSSNRRVYEMFKLGLDPGREMETALAERFPNLVKPPPDYEDVELLVVDYLKDLRLCLDRYLSNLPNSIGLGSGEKDWVITCPAMWTERAKDKTRACARSAGMTGRITTVSEPEAAAIRILEDMSEDTFQLGDTFLVCDAGGGTVDLISYTVKGFKDISESKHVLEVEEATRGEGHVCGGIFINAIFKQWMQNTYRTHPEFNEEVLADAVREFEDKLKKSFDGGTYDNDEYPMFVRIREGHQITRNQLKISGRRMKTFFDPVFVEIEDLIQRQINATENRFKCIVLVGGLGGNKYLKKRLEERFGDDVKISKAKNSLTAVVEGAVYKGLADAQPNPVQPGIPRVNRRIAPRSYGTKMLVDYDATLHAGLQKEPRGMSGREQVEVMEWFVEQNALLSSSNPFDYHWTRKCMNGIPNDMEITMHIYCFESAPYQGSPVDPRAAGVRELGVLKMKVAEMPDGAMRQQSTSRNIDYYVWEFQIQMILESASLKFVLLVQGSHYDEMTIMDYT